MVQVSLKLNFISLKRTVVPLQPGAENGGKEGTEGQASAWRQMMRRENVEMFLANHLDYCCIIGLPVAYALMTLFTFEFIKI